MVHGRVHGLLRDLGMTVNSADSLADRLGTVFTRCELSGSLWKSGEYDGKCMDLRTYLNVFKIYMG